MSKPRPTFSLNLRLLSTSQPQEQGTQTPSAQRSAHPPPLCLSHGSSSTSTTTSSSSGSVSARAWSSSSPSGSPESTSPKEHTPRGAGSDSHFVKAASMFTETLEMEGVVAARLLDSWCPFRFIPPARKDDVARVPDPPVLRARKRSGAFDAWCADMRATAAAKLRACERKRGAVSSTAAARAMQLSAQPQPLPPPLPQQPLHTPRMPSLAQQHRQRRRSVAIDQAVLQQQFQALQLQEQQALHSKRRSTAFDPQALHSQLQQLQQPSPPPLPPPAATAEAQEPERRRSGSLSVRASGGNISALTASMPLPAQPSTSVLHRSTPSPWLRPGAGGGSAAFP